MFNGPRGDVTSNPAHGGRRCVGAVACRAFVIALGVMCFTPAARAQVVLPLPALPEPRVVTERGTSPVYHRLSPRIVLPLFRGALGATVRMPLGGYDAQVAFTAEVHGGAVVRFGRGANIGIIAEVGYTYEGFDLHLATAGLGGIRGIEPPRDDEHVWDRFHFAVIPHVVVGTAYDALALGARPSVVVGYSLWAVELSWQVLSVRDALTQEARVTFTTITPFMEAL